MKHQESLDEEINSIERGTKLLIMQSSAGASNIQINNEDESEQPVRQDQPFLKCSVKGPQNKSATLISTASTLADYNTPPESPSVLSDHSSSEDEFGEANQHLTAQKTDSGVVADKPPIAPPRHRRQHQQHHINLHRTVSDSPQRRLNNPHMKSNLKMNPLRSQSQDQQGLLPQQQQVQSLVRGHLSMLVISAKGFRQMMKVRWFVICKRSGKLKYYRSEDESELLGEIDIKSATFCYDAQMDKNGEFTICTRSGEQILSAGTGERRMFWLQQLQKARREFAHTNASHRSSLFSSQGLLKETGSTAAVDGTDHSNLKDHSPFREIMATMERPSSSHGVLGHHFNTQPNSPAVLAAAQLTSPPKSADCVQKKTSFFQSFTKNKALRMPRSASMRTPSPPGTPNSGANYLNNNQNPVSIDLKSPPHPKFQQLQHQMSSPAGSNQGFSALSKIRRSFRDMKASGSGYSIAAGSPAGSPKRFLQSSGSIQLTDAESRLREDLQAAKEESAANKEIVALLRKQVEILQKEQETMRDLTSGMEDTHLIEILRTKDAQIVELESEAKENQKVIDLQENQLEKLKEDLKIHQEMFEAKDETIVKLTNQLHEAELNTAVLKSNSHSPGVMSGNSGISSGGNKISSNGISFDSDKFEFREFVDVGSQTSTDLLEDKEKEQLSDTVVAYEMQNKFLNKEVLELNHLRQQAADREQKNFIEASDWEAKFYQIQSKYLLLLNELHNPQVGVSSSRQEMVSQLLKDIVDAADTPAAAFKSKSASYDRLGFRVNTDANDEINENNDDEKQNAESESTENPVSVLEEKAEKLRLQSVAESETVSFELEKSERKWDELISSLNSNGSKFPAFDLNSSEVKKMLRQGIPFCQKGAVWKAIIDHKLLRASLNGEAFPRDYYQKLLSNYNPTGMAQNLTPAAKQIELDLLRTLPTNKHYDGPHADGIPKLRRVLLAYSIHSPEVEYCQGFNRIIAIALLFMNEEDAFWLLIYIVEHLMPPEYYSRDKQLIGAQVDQEVLKELLAEKIPKLGSHFANHGIDPSLFSLNWFLCIFVDALPVRTYLHIWDSYLFEGSKVLFRYAIAVFKILEDRLLTQTDYMSIFNTFREQTEQLTDIKMLTQVAFNDLNPFPMRSINNKREHHYKLLEARKRELDHIRQNYRKNSMARSPKSGSISAGLGAVAATVGAGPGVVGGGNIATVSTFFAGVDDYEEDEEEISESSQSSISEVPKKH